MKGLELLIEPGSVMYSALQGHSQHMLQCPKALKVAATVDLQPDDVLVWYLGNHEHDLKSHMSLGSHA